jgi:hypothetical protein
MPDGVCRDFAGGIYSSQHVDGLSRPRGRDQYESQGSHLHLSEFLKYEEVMDTFMPPSRRNNDFCKSNKSAVRGNTNKPCHEALASSRTITELCDTMNP